MKFKIKIINSLLISLYSFFTLLCLSLNCLADNRAVIQKIAGYIVDYNNEQIKLLEAGDSYRGEEGILFIDPKAGLKLGLKVYTDQDYNDAIDLFEKADEALSDGEQVLSYRGKTEGDPYIINKVISNMLTYRETSSLAKEKLVKYRKRINKEQDERFNEEICNKLILTFLDEGLQETSNNLRDALACFYNKCHGIKYGSHYLSPSNMRFVNNVYNRFMAHASKEEVKLFDTDTNLRNGEGSEYGEWKEIVKEEVPDFLIYFESAVEKGGSTYKTDPLLFLALVKKESTFRPRAISFVGAAGLAQLMPQTALDLGLANVYMPEYFKKAGELSSSEREMRAKAKDRLLSISKKDDTPVAKEARKYILKSIEAGEKRKELLKRYKKELADKENDDRFDPQKVIEAGYIHFARLMKTNNGDISLALASYNAGYHRVKEFDGIPPFRETIGFRNLILQYYREYLEELTE